MITKKKLLLCLLIPLLLVGCATVNVQLTPQDASDWMLSIYNAQYADYKTWFYLDATTGLEKLKPNTPEAQARILQQKKAIFKEVWPLILTYADYAKTGTVPVGTAIDQVEIRATQLINELIRVK